MGFQNYPQYTSNDYKYLESQSLSLSSGRLFVGMYPWGELYEIKDSGETKIHRFFSSPVRSDDQQPYRKNADSFYSSEKSPVDIASVGYAEYWGQRIPSIAVFDGKVCISTANTYSQKYSDKMHPFLTAAEEKKYGRVHCAKLPAQTMHSFDGRLGGHYSFVVSNDHLSILRDGEVLTQRPHSLSKDVLEDLLSSEGELVVGAGLYGKSPVNIQQVGQ